MNSSEGALDRAKHSHSGTLNCGALVSMRSAALQKSGANAFLSSVTLGAILVESSGVKSKSPAIAKTKAYACKNEKFLEKNKVRKMGKLISFENWNFIDYVLILDIGKVENSNKQVF